LSSIIESINFKIINMGLWDKLKNEFIDIIEWKDSSNDTIVWRFPRYQDEIKQGAKLTVREGQVAVFINNGKIADVYQPGMHTLETSNMPILSTIMGWKHGFNSPFKAEVYFVNTKNFTDQKWGTKNPIMMRDVEFGPVRLRAFGTYVFKVNDAATFMREIVGTDGNFTTDEITNQLRNMIISRFTDALGESKIPVLDLAANYDELGEFIRNKIDPEFSEYGITITKYLVENISLPPEVEKMLDKRTSMGVLGNLNQYAQFQAANAMEKAAENPGGGGEGMSMGMGMAMANQMGNMFNQNTNQNQNQQGNAGGAPPPLPQSVSYFVAKDGQQTGPFDMNALSNMAKEGSFTKESLVWKQGMDGWKASSEVSELAKVFGAVPPPLPPPM
jgi:membrane protease subunit (stomatin/prohibitin family)